MELPATRVESPSDDDFMLSHSSEVHFSVMQLSASPTIQ